MVSFQCDVCADTVKKPKLDQHYGRCHGSVTCIDCSRTFYTPAEFKGHTSCISEAEKYQKGLYKGSSNNSARGAQQRGRGAYAAGTYNRGRTWIPRSQASGANGTPLGTPIRMSPVFDVDNSVAKGTSSVPSDVGAVAVPIISSAPKHAADVTGAAKESSDAWQNNAEVGAKPVKGKKEKKSKNAQEVAPTEVGASTEVSIAINGDRSSEKKAKKEKITKSQAQVEVEAQIASTSEELIFKEKKKSKKSKSTIAQAEPAVNETSAEPIMEESAPAPTKKKSKKSKAVVDATAVEDVDISSKKRKRSNPTAGENGEEAQEATEQKDKKKKKSKHNVDSGEPASANVPAIDEQETLGDGEKKKRKKEKKAKKDTTTVVA